MVNVGNTLLYTFFGVCQVIILFSQGGIIHLKKLSNPQGMKSITRLIVNIFVPCYSILEMSKVSSIEKLSEYWILAFLCAACLILRMLIMLVLNRIFDIDYKISSAYALICAFPSLGSLTLVIGEALCYPNCPLNGDPMCEDVLGLMIIIFLINCIAIFLGGLTFVADSKITSTEIKDRLKFVWYVVLTEFKKPDLFAKYLIYKYCSEDIKEEVYERFIKAHKLECTVDKDFKYKHIIENNKIEIADGKNAIITDNKLEEKFNNKEISEGDSDVDSEEKKNKKSQEEVDPEYLKEHVDKVHDLNPKENFLDKIANSNQGTNSQKSDYHSRKGSYEVKKKLSSIKLAEMKKNSSVNKNNKHNKKSSKEYKDLQYFHNESLEHSNENNKNNINELNNFHVIEEISHDSHEENRSSLKNDKNSIIIDVIDNNDDNNKTNTNNKDLIDKKRNSKSNIAIPTENVNNNEEDNHDYNNQNIQTEKQVLSFKQQYKAPKIVSSACTSIRKFNIEIARNNIEKSDSIIFTSKGIKRKISMQQKIQDKYLSYYENNQSISNLRQNKYNSSAMSIGGNFFGAKNRSRFFSISNEEKDRGAMNKVKSYFYNPVKGKNTLAVNQGVRMKRSNSNFNFLKHNDTVDKRRSVTNKYNKHSVYDNFKVIETDHDLVHNLIDRILNKSFKEELQNKYLEHRIADTNLPSIIVSCNDNKTSSGSFDDANNYEHFCNSFTTKKDFCAINSYYNCLFNTIEANILVSPENSFQLKVKGYTKDKSPTFFISPLEMDGKISVKNDVIEKIKKDKSKLLVEFNKEKLTLLENINCSSLPRFFPVDSLKIFRREKEDFGNIWKIYTSKALENNIQIELTKQTKISCHYLFSKLFTPPIVCCILGMFIGVSGMRDVLYSKNHYIVNVRSCIYIYSRCFLPLLMANAGYSLLDAPKITPNLSMNNLQLSISLLVSLVIFPLLGIGFTSLLENTYGGIIEESKVFKYSVFIPFCLPPTANMIVVINILDNFYIKEFSYILNRHYLICLFTETILLLGYFVWIGD